MHRVFLKKLGKNIRNARLANNLSQEKLAELIGKPAITWAWLKEQN